MLISGGENIHPVEVENAVLAHQSVADVAVIGVRDERWGQVGLAAVVLKRRVGATAAKIKGTFGQRLVGFKVPRCVDFLPTLPRNGAGKINKQELRGQYSSAPTSECRVNA